MKFFRSPGAAQRFLAVFSAISPHFRPGRRKFTASDYRSEMTDRFATWNDDIGVPRRLKPVSHQHDSHQRNRMLLIPNYV